ncbi:Uncharacterized protein HZ326_1290 [Fusarium oxysporum f. sp. albedinis]|nr:Uncharacterized protein HZ326_1290 [Fusarium oxysporum f. sp. albedinis]
MAGGNYGQWYRYKIVYIPYLRYHPLLSYKEAVAEMDTTRVSLNDVAPLSKSLASESGIQTIISRRVIKL